VSRANDGNYLFLGRLDRQVKRRGFRIELGEIETALASCEDILEAAAVAVEDGKKGTAIIAFVRTRSAITLVEAKAHCARTLPLYMVPDDIIFLDAMPTGGTGKIDYLALSGMAKTLNHAASEHAAPEPATPNHAAPNHGDQDRSPAIHR
jgi:acyl-coenzyme A synthetase/AMP-(fatty) acid ligase